MIGLRYCCAGLLLVSSLSGLAWGDLPPASAEWELEREEDGIRIYNHPMPDSQFNAFKATTELDAPLNKVMAVMLDPESCMEWVHGCSHSEGLPGGTFRDRLAYSVNDLPWPATDRDYVLHIRTHTETESNAGSNGGEQDRQPTIVMEMSAVKNDYQAGADRIRVEHSDTLYRFSDTGDGTTHMTWIQHTEPNGSLPAWLVNSLSVDIPFKSLQELQEVTNESEYAGYELVFDQGGQLVDVRPSKAE